MNRSAVNGSEDITDVLSSIHEQIEHLMGDVHQDGSEAKEVLTRLENSGEDSIEVTLTITTLQFEINTPAETKTVGDDRDHLAGKD